MSAARAYYVYVVPLAAFAAEALVLRRVIGLFGALLGSVAMLTTALIRRRHPESLTPIIASGFVVSIVGGWAASAKLFDVCLLLLNVFLGGAYAVALSLRPSLGIVALYILAAGGLGVGINTTGVTQAAAAAVAVLSLMGATMLKSRSATDDDRGGE
jgi:hypothetical protein